jgi:hypothetical protein
MDGGSEPDSLERGGDSGSLGLFEVTFDKKVPKQSSNEAEMPRGPAGHLRFCLRLEGGCAGFGYGVVLYAGASADSDGAHNFAFLLEGDAAGEDHDLAVV